MFKKLYNEWKGEEHLTDSQYKAIPKFYFKVHIFSMINTLHLCMWHSILFSDCSVIENKDGVPLLLRLWVTLENTTSRVVWMDSELKTE